jgi:hypothetical protein
VVIAVELDGIVGTAVDQVLGDALSHPAKVKRRAIGTRLTY